MKVTAILIAATAIVIFQLTTEISSYSTRRLQRIKQAPYPTPGYPDGPSFTLPGEYGPANLSTEATTTTQMVNEPATEPASETVTEEATKPVTEVATEEAVPPEAQPEENGDTTEEEIEATTDAATTMVDVGLTTEEGTVATNEEEESLAEVEPMIPEGVTRTSNSLSDEGYPVYIPVSEETDDQSEVSVVENEEGYVARGDSADYGAYYIYHPSGLLQRVVFSTQEDAQNMGYTAQLSYQHVEHIQNPIFTYDPDTYVFRELQFSA